MLNDYSYLRDMIAVTGVPPGRTKAADEWSATVRRDCQSRAASG
jgi:hypothetical protein